MTTRLMTRPERIHFWGARTGVLAVQVAHSVWRHKWLWIALLGALFWLDLHYKLCINASSSIKRYEVFLVDKSDHNLKRGDYFAFRWHGGGPYGAGTTFGKIVMGMPGDLVTAQGARYYVNGTYVGTAKPRATTGQVLVPGPTGVIPPGRYFAYAPNPDSLDSRYAITGWINSEAVIGRAIPLF